jgi:phage shock protein PspC (stress-responsive transcriptional regulator)
MEQTRLYRNQKNSIIGGVCGGLAEYFKTDPVIIRVLFAIVFFVGGSGLLVYIVLWIITPLEQAPVIKPFENQVHEEENINHEVKSENMESQKKQKNDGNLWGGLILITIGAIFLIEKFVPALDFGDLWPLILVVVGVILISKNFQKQKE